MKNWYVVQCKAREEARATQQLRNQSYVVLHPQACISRLSRGRRQTRVESLFPGYIFVQLDIHDCNWASIRSTRGAVDLVRCGRLPIALPESTIQSINDRIDPETGLINLAEQQQRLKRGQRVYLTEGPFAGHEGLFQAHCGQERVIVLLNILQKSVRVTVPEHILEGA